MGKRYYCDYCDRTLPYSVEGRKKHCTGYQHLTFRRNYYNKFKTATERLHDELKKPPCRKFFSGQNCTFGADCIYSHMTESDFDQLKIKSKQEQSLTKQLHIQILESKKPAVDEIIQNIEDVARNGSSSILENLLLEYQKPISNLEKQISLPLSLKSFTMDDLYDCVFTEWG